MTWPALLALLWALATLTAYRSRLRPALRRAAVALALLAAADAVRFALAGPQSGEAVRLDVALSLLWPTVAAWLIAGPIALAWLAYAVALALWGRRLALHWTAALQLPRYAVGALATVENVRRRPWEHSAASGSVASDHDLPRVGVHLDPDGLRAAEQGHHAAQSQAAQPWSASQRIGLLLAVGQVSAAFAGMWSRWDQMRLASALIYAAIGVAVLFEPRSR